MTPVARARTRARPRARAIARARARTRARAKANTRASEPVKKQRARVLNNYYLQSGNDWPVGPGFK